MPPLRAHDRASKACDTCRKQKTRCYPSTGRQCLRCETLRQDCSLAVDESLYAGQSGHSAIVVTGVNPIVDDRLSRLEAAVQSLTTKIDEKSSPQNLQRSPSPPHPVNTPGDGDTAPVVMIRDVADEIATERSASHFDSPALDKSDILSKGLISAPEAQYLISLFHEQYGRWITLDMEISPNRVFQHMLRSPLLLCSTCLIAVRHSNEQLAERLGLPLFNEVEALAGKALLSLANSIDFFQAVLVLSLWSTTIGRSPLSIDGWLLTNYAIQQAQASPLFQNILAMRDAQMDLEQLSRGFIWVHLCLAHLQYCIGTRRKTVLSEGHIRVGKSLLAITPERLKSNFERRMVAEVELYWIIYHQHSRPSHDRKAQELALYSWKLDCADLFEEPRSQFLQMGYYFALLLLHCQRVSSQTSSQHTRTPEMVRLSTSIINLAIETADERTAHLTDHIYHIITFAALTLLRLLSTEEEQLSASHDITALDRLVTNLVAWLRSIGLRCHVAHLLGDIVSAQQRKLRPDTRPSPATSSIADNILSADFAAMYPDFLSAGILNGPDQNMWTSWDAF